MLEIRSTRKSTPFQHINKNKFEKHVGEIDSFIITTKTLYLRINLIRILKNQ
jgi:hypothetical protein